MKKIYLSTLIVLSFLSCEPRNASKTTKTVDTVKVETLDERIKSSDSVLLNNRSLTSGQALHANTREILKNQIVIMKKLNELHK